MPDILSIPLGGGIRIRADNGCLMVGPDCVGHRLTREALAFGGGTPTVSDAAVHIGRASLGNRSPDSWSNRTDWTQVIAHVDRCLAEAVDRAWFSRRPMPLVVVGGGSILAPERLPGVSEIIRPANCDVANAIGAAIAPASGQIDRLFNLSVVTREAALDEGRQLATDEAIRAGADPSSVQIVDLEELTISYLASPVLRIRAKAAGALGSL